MQANIFARTSSLVPILVPKCLKSSKLRLQNAYQAPNLNYTLRPTLWTLLFFYTLRIQLYPTWTDIKARKLHFNLPMPYNAMRSQVLPLLMRSILVHHVSSCRRLASAKTIPLV